MPHVKNAGWRPRLTEVTLPAGEARKDMASLETILDAALKDRHERGSLFIALGGGVAVI